MYSGAKVVGGAIADGVSAVGDSIYTGTNTIGSGIVENTGIVGSTVKSGAQTIGEGVNAVGSGALYLGQKAYTGVKSTSNFLEDKSLLALNTVADNIINF